MRLAFYWTYATRSLRRGGQRTVMAIFCIAVGVMAIVALQLASLMIATNLTSNVRAANGGDISIRQDIIPFKQSDLSYLYGLKGHDGVTNVTAVTDDRGSITHDSRTYSAVIGAVDPRNYPLAGQPAFVTPRNGDLGRLLSTPGAAVLGDGAASDLGVTVGDRVTLHGTAGRVLTVRVAGIVQSSSEGVDAYVQRAAYARSGKPALTYNVVYLTTTDDAATKYVSDLLKKHYPLATVQTVADALKQRQDQTTLLHQLLQVVGIIALLIGGFGVVNTMNVLLARRRTEIAMLKTAGYRRRDLYALFSLEAAVLGVIGGVAGAVVGVGLSYGVKSLIENAFQLHLPFVVDPGSILMGVLVGLCTAVIFGLQPIVHAAFIRPQAVLRDLPERSNVFVRMALSALLFVILSVLFCILASVILGNALWGIAVVYGTFAILGLLSLVFGAIVWVIGRLGIPERLSPLRIVIAAVVLALAIALAFVLPGVGGLVVLIVAVLGFGVAFLPRSWKVTIKMAFRNIGRQRTRATMTLLALFVGVFSVGLIVILGQDIRDKLSAALASQLDYNVYSLVPAQYAGQVDRALPHLSGYKKSSAVNAVQTMPVAVNGQPILPVLERAPRGGARNNLGINGTLAFLSGFTGYRLGYQSTDATIVKGLGRNLTAADSGTTNVLLPSLLHQLGPLHLKVGDRVTLANTTQTQVITVRVVGFYNYGFLGTRYPILASRTLVHRFAGAEEMDIYSLKIDPSVADKAVAELNRAAPRAVTVNLTNLGAIVDQILGNLVILLVALASLALFAGVIIIANAVALAMLERRREQGILKSVGYTSQRVLATVLVENGVIGGLGGILGMGIVAIATFALSKTLFKTGLDVSSLTSLALIALVTVIALVTASLVSWGATRVRPIEVLRYE